jgi:hypothetical protein
MLKQEKRVRNTNVCGNEYIERPNVDEKAEVIDCCDNAIHLEVQPTFSKFLNITIFRQESLRFLP